MQGPIHVKSEIGPLQKVLLHRPGRELEYLVPDALERLLFDDIPYLHGAQQEHDRFVQLLRENGTEVVFLENLTAEAIETDDSVRDAFIDAVISGAGALAEYYRPELTEYLKSISDAHVLVEKTMSGICVQELPASQKSCLGRLMQQDDHFVMDPIPNLYFTRDPFACIGNGVSLNRMHSQTRCRETIYGRFILKYHPEFSDRVPLYYTPELPTSIEGGDILNLSAQVIAVGVSQRTQPESVELLAHNLFDAQDCSVDTVLVFDIPHSRAFMHLDTVLTQVDTDTFTVHPGILDRLHIYEITPAAGGQLHIQEMVRRPEEVLAHYLHQDHVRLIRCGGESAIAAQREQWNDGSNTLCIRPGCVVVYDRNHITNQILTDAGIEVLTVPSAELSRGRGGPRCMSMPLCRAAL